MAKKFYEGLWSFLVAKNREKLKNRKNLKKSRKIRKNREKRRDRKEELIWQKVTQTMELHVEYLLWFLFLVISRWLMKKTQASRLLNICKNVSSFSLWLVFPFFNWFNYSDTFKKLDINNLTVLQLILRWKQPGQILLIFSHVVTMNACAFCKKVAAWTKGRVNLSKMSTTEKSWEPS